MSIINQRSIVENLTFYDRQNLIWDFKCTPGEKLVLFALNMHADSNGECFPGLKRIEQKCNIGRVDRITDRLMQIGILTKRHRFNESGRQTSNGYQILFDRLKDVDLRTREVDLRSRGDGSQIQGEVDLRSRGDGSQIQGEVDLRSRGDGSQIQGEVDLRSIKLDHIELPSLTSSERTTHSNPDPERVCEKIKNDSDPGSVIVPDTSKPLPVFSESIGVDNFSAAAPLNSSIEGFPIGPWGRDLFSIHPGFMAAVIAKWRKGNSQKAQAFGAMVDEEVRGCIQKYWRKDWTTLHLDWTEYEDSTKRLAATVHDRMAQGVEISTQEQKILTDRVMGPEHLRPQAPHSVTEQATLNPVRVQRELPPGAVPLIVPGELTESQIEENRRAIEAARSNLMKSDQSLFLGRSPNHEFIAWLLEEAKKTPIPGMTIRAIAMTLARRPETQSAYRQSIQTTALEREPSFSESEDF